MSGGMEAPQLLTLKNQNSGVFNKTARQRWPQSKIQKECRLCLSNPP
jgi:hypothetical protein